MAGLTNRDIAGVFRDIEVLMQVLGEDARRAQTYGRVAWQIERMEASAADLAVAGRLVEQKGIGPKIQAAVAELVDRGTCARLEELVARAPPGLPELLKVPGLGPKRLHTVLAELEVRTIEELKAAATDGRLAALKGFGPKSAEKILAGILFLERSRGLARMDDAERLAADVIRALGLRQAVACHDLERGVRVPSFVERPGHVELAGAALADEENSRRGTGLREEPLERPARPSPREGMRRMRNGATRTSVPPAPRTGITGWCPI